ncbi:ABC-F family ATP-binding cassette domain-containing protein [Corallococcus terminator]
MTLLRAANVQLSFGSRTVFQGLTVTIEDGERVGLVGVNGSGKTSLMKILAGAAKPDTGELQLRRGARVTYLPQEPEFAEGATVASELSVAQGPLREAMAAQAELAQRLEDSPPEAHEKLMEQLSVVSDRIEQMGGWDTEHHAKTLLDRLGVKDWDRPVAQLSGGLRKRVAIARALLTRPDMLLLDEPTNHLDADTVDWLEEELDKLPGSLLLVTHDRYFLDGLVDRIVEIQPGGGVTSYPGNYQAYLEQKLVAQENSEVAQHKRERWIAQEVAWLRRGPEARRTKSKSRIDRAQKLMAEKGFQRPKVADLRVIAAPRLGHTVIESEGLHKAFGERKVLQGVDFRLQRGERVGLVGPNGVGKTTFLRVILGELPPDGGKLVIGKNTKVAYYDQNRAQLDPEMTVYDAASQGEDWVDLGDQKVALRDYLDDLLFPVPMQRMKVKALSGGERNRLLLARLFLEGANVLVLDEPTNDLDIVTLNVLERLLLDFGGSTLLVTHDRYFLDKVATSIVTFDGNGRVTRYEGNYAMYRRLKEQSDAMAAKGAQKKDEPAPAAVAPAPKQAARKAVKLSYKDQRELDGMEATIEVAETRKAELEAQLADPTFYSKSGKVAEVQKELDAAVAEIERLYARWQVLQDLAAGAT